MGTYALQFTLKLGKAETVGRLSSLRRPEQGKFKLCTPDGKPVSQVYRDENGVVYEKEELERAKVLPGGVYKMVDAEELDEARTSKLPPNYLNLTVHKRSDIDASVFPSDNNAYIFEPGIRTPKGKLIPSEVNDRWYDFINVVLRDNDDITLLGEANLRKNQGLFRLTLWKGMLLLQKQLYPEDLHEDFEVSPSTLAGKDAELAVAASMKMLQGFNPLDYRDTITSRVEALTDADKAAGFADQPAAVFDFTRELEKMLE